MNRAKKSRAAYFWAALSIPVMWLALIAGGCAGTGKTIGDFLPDFFKAANAPFAVKWTEYSARALLVSFILYGFLIALYYSMKGNRRPGEEHGSAKWGDPSQLCKKYQNKRKQPENIILTQNIQMGMDGRRHFRNLNTLIVGGSGAGKTRFYCKPNIMQLNCSYIVTDPKGETSRALAPLLREKGIPMTVLNLVNMAESDSYNPFMYIHSDEDALRLVSNLIKNTTPKNAQQSDPFWEKSETALLQALILYLKYEAPPREQNFNMVMYLIENAAASDEGDSVKTPIDILFEEVEDNDPDNIALKQWKVFKQANGKTAKSILVSAAVRLAAFNLPELARLTEYDDMDFGSLGETKRVIFAIIADSDATFNYIVGMLYSQAFQELYLKADRRDDGRLPVHVRVIMDEFANVALPDDFERILSTCRSREISINIIIQNIAQIKALFEKSWENLTGNCDSFLYLGGNEQSTHKYISELLGKETIVRPLGCMLKPAFSKR
jgi:type IV secretion system protein VirD4